ncbi:MAG TPA: hypothetical protein VJP87_04775 [Candidatus Acidoferrales bacterium]|nr:hypothetical protein [Candidatus Acidoferrales bacterium]
MARHVSYQVIGLQKHRDQSSARGESRGAHGATLFGLAAGVLILTGTVLEFLVLGYLQIHVPGPWPASLVASAATNAAALCARLSPWSSVAPIVLIAAGLCAVPLANAVSRNVLVRR